MNYYEHYREKGIRRVNHCLVTLIKEYLDCSMPFISEMALEDCERSLIEVEYTKIKKQRNYYGYLCFFMNINNTKKELIT